VAGRAPKSELDKLRAELRDKYRVPLAERLGASGNSREKSDENGHVQVEMGHSRPVEGSRAMKRSELESRFGIVRDEHGQEQRRMLVNGVHHRVEQYFRHDYLQVLQYCPETDQVRVSPVGKDVHDRAINCNDAPWQPLEP
jgi:hypothetical protein